MWYYRFLKKFYGLAGTPTILQERIIKALEFKHPSWLDDIFIVIKGNIEEHETEAKETMKKLEEAGYRLHPKKCEFFQKETEYVGHKINQPKRNQTTARHTGSIHKNKYTKNRKKQKSFVKTTLIKVHRNFISTN